MARPRKALDMNLILELRGKGLSARKIAERLGGVSYRTILRLGHDLGQNVGTKPIPLTPKASLVRSPTREPHPTLTRPFASIHRFWLSLAYSGVQPTTGIPTPYKNNVYYRIETEEYTLDVHKNRILVWIHGITGEDSSDLKAKARGRGRAVIAGFAQQHGLTPLWSDYREIPEPEYVLEPGPLNTALMGVLGPKRGESKEKLGLLPGDTTHQQNIEAHHTVGEISIDSLYWLTHTFPDDWRAEREIVKAFAVNMKSHLAAISELRDAVRELRDAVKEKG
jgi:hypothetical protein